MAVQSTFYSITKKTFDCIIYIIFNPKNQNISGAMVRQLGIFVKIRVAPNLKILNTNTLPRICW